MDILWEEQVMCVVQNNLMTVGLNKADLFTHIFQV